ncbi:hypothetical protein N9M22_06635, partial [Litoricolaceae bacterium]|nr:hypothetical protein [Litorivicinaceae bacterium]
LGLDAAFFAVYTISLFSTLVFLNEPKNINLMVGAAFFTGIAFWGRGNSAPTIGLILFIPLIWWFFEQRVWRDNRLILSGAGYGFIVLILASYFYYSNWQPLSDYYLNHQRFFSRHEWNFADAEKWIFNIPGFLFWRQESSLPTIMITVTCHLIFGWLTIFPFLSGSKSFEKVKLLRMLSLTGGFIYFGQLAINVIFFTDPLFSLQNVLLIYRPMLLGMAVLLISAIIHFSSAYKLNLPMAAIPLVLICLTTFAMFFTWIQTPWKRGSELISPVELEQWALSVQEIVGEGAVNILYYSHINPRIINYYRAKNGLGPANMVYNPPGYDRMWSASDYSDENKKSTRDTIRFIIKNSSMLLLPERPDMYGNSGPYAFYKFHADWLSVFQEAGVPKFYIVDKFLMPRGDLLVLMPEELSADKSRPLVLPLGTVDY